jgi:hypothetical protein
MSKGPGRIEQAIADVFTRHPDRAFTVDELATFAFPGVNLAEKKHRVSIIRAANKVAERLHWTGRRAQRRGGQLVFSNLLNVRSYRLGMLRRDYCYNDKALHDVETLLEKEREKLEPGGVWHLHVEINRAELQGDAETADRLRRELVWVVSAQNPDAFAH